MRNAGKDVEGCLVEHCLVCVCVGGGGGLAASKCCLGLMTDNDGRVL